MWHLHFEFTLYLCQLYPIILSIVEAHICPINAGQSHVGLKVVHLSKHPYDPRWSSCFTLTVADVAGSQPENGTCWKILSIKQVQTECSDRKKILYQTYTNHLPSFRDLTFHWLRRPPEVPPPNLIVLHVEGSVRAAGLQKRLFPWPRRSTQICYIWYLLIWCYIMLFYHVMKWL